jgi:hypothetical protein
VQQPLENIGPHGNALQNVAKFICAGEILFRQGGTAAPPLFFVLLIGAARQSHLTSFKTRLLADKRKC